jgi:Family of unknown function (DUF6221)
MDMDEFLLARIVEDEAWGGQPHADERATLARQGSLHSAAGLHRSPCTSWRVLADCDAKRRIIEWHRPLQADNPDRPDQVLIFGSECEHEGLLPRVAARVSEQLAGFGRRAGTRCRARRASRNDPQLGHRWHDAPAQVSAGAFRTAVARGPSSDRSRSCSSRRRRRLGALGAPSWVRR